MKTANALVCLLLVLMTGCQSMTTPGGLSQQDREDLAAALEDYARAMRANDAASKAAMFTENAVVVPHNGAVLRGRDEIRSFHEANSASYPTTAFNYEIDSIEGSGDVASIRGTLTFTVKPKDAEPLSFFGSFMEIRERQANGSWAYVRDIWTQYPVLK